MSLENMNTVKADCDIKENSLALLRDRHQFCGSDSRLYTEVGMRTTREMVSIGEAGYLLFGPYLSLAAGAYRVVVRGKLGDFGTAAAHVEITVDGGKRILTMSALDNSDQDGHLASLPVLLQEPCIGFEVRVWVEAESQVTISMVEIQPCETSELESRDQPRPDECLDILPQDEPPGPLTQQIRGVEQISTTGPPLVHQSDAGPEDGISATGMITLENLTKVYDTRKGPRIVLDGIDLVINTGEKVGILGRNGSGKSTLIRLISGAELPTSGRIHRGMSVSWPLAFSGGFQGTLTGLDNLRFICRIYGADYETAVPFVEEFSELGQYLREPVKTYSSGMRSRLNFAISMAVEFDCFLIDEIIAVGDSRFHGKCNTELFEKRKDRAMILVSHYPGMIRDHCNRAGVLVAGKLHIFEQVDEALAFYERDSLGLSPQ